MVVYLQVWPKEVDPKADDYPVWPKGVCLPLPMEADHLSKMADREEVQTRQSASQADLLHLLREAIQQSHPHHRQSV
jgi:hypothetical protein